MIGSLLMRTPMACDTAFATAASGGMIEASPTPRRPNGWRGLGTSIMTGSTIGTSSVVGIR